MKAEDFVQLYQNREKRYGKQAYTKISQLLKAAKAQHKKDFKGKDFEQSWKPIKGKGLERIIKYIITKQTKALGLAVIDGNKLERINRHSEIESSVKRSILIDYGKFGSHIPDADIVIYEPRTNKAIAVISSKTTLRERIAQTGYWKMKLAADKATKHIKVYFLTPDEDKVLIKKHPSKKARAIVETDIDGSYVLSSVNIEESNKVKMFDKFLDDLKHVVKNLETQKT